jgi:hypothetical protein
MAEEAPREFGQGTFGEGPEWDQNGHGVIDKDMHGKTKNQVENSCGCAC